MKDKIDVLYLYKLTHFDGFAPCFDDGLFSLVCCMGDKRTGGMRASACNQYIQEKNVWILGVCSKELSNNPQNNVSGILYSEMDMIYLAKVTDTLSLREYSDRFIINKTRLREDAIYYYNENIKKLIQLDNPHHSQENIPTDTAINKKDNVNIKQAIISEEFYIFPEKHRCMLDVPRRKYLISVDGKVVLKEYIKGNLNSLIINKSPFVKKTYYGKKGC